MDYLEEKIKSLYIYYEDVTQSIDELDHMELLEEYAEDLGITSELKELQSYYTDFDEFIKHDMDAVVLANYAHQHAPFAIKCFERGIHVLSECISNGTMAEGVELIRAYEKSSSIFMLAENYPQMIFNREMKKICDGGTLGKILYAEGEYNHPLNSTDYEFYKGYIYFPEHWRNFLPRSYYVTHSLAPLMWSTGATPKKVSAFGVFSPIDEYGTARYVGDSATIMMTQNDDGSVFKFTGCGAFGAHHNAYRICGKKGQIENLRGMGNKVMLRYNHWEIPEGMEEVNLYKPSWNDKDEDLINNAGHGGGDYGLVRDFVEAVASEDPGKLSSSIKDSIESHVMGFAAEKSRKSNNKVAVKA